MTTSLIYRTGGGYELLMRALYWPHYRDRLRAVADQVPPGASVLELCCGPGTLYRRHLRARTRDAGAADPARAQSPYIGIDINPGFVAALRRDGIEARQVDLIRYGEPLPCADVALIQASLYHFLPRPAELIDRMLEAARDRVIVSEPVRNLACSASPVVRRLARRGADPGVGGHAHRFTEAGLDELMEQYRDRRLKAFKIPGGREKVYVLDARPRPPA